MTRFFLILFLAFVSQIANAWSLAPDSLNKEQIEIVQPKLIVSHPLGIYMMRLESNFRTKALSKKTIAIQISSANVWEPTVTAYKPLNESDRNNLNRLVWYDREFAVDLNTLSSDRIQFFADAVIKGIQLTYSMPTAKNQELRIDLRSYLFTAGKLPYSVLSSDQLIEYFHSHIAGGEDPFARKYYGLDQVGISYIDEKGRTISNEANDFILPGIEAHYTYFVPSKFLHEQNFYLNFGAHLGINTSSSNPSSDLGISATAIKQFKSTEHSFFEVAAGSSLMLPRWIHWGESVNINNTKFLFTANWQLSYEKKTPRARWKIALNNRYQSPYQNPNDLAGIVLAGERISSHWHYAISHLYVSNTVWNLVFSYATIYYSLSLYVSEDIEVNNAPDIQTGVQIGIPLSF